ncbi:MAG: FAD-dependent oxidoreductase [Flavobacteriales bacterium]
MSHVVIIGGGVAGMSAAHELIERGFSVEVFERHKQYVGGKARSVNVPETNLQFPDKYLPGEHGFRFFPGFYKHVTDTMKRIPFRKPDGTMNAQGCFGNLTPTKRIMIARYGKPPIVTIASFPRSLADLKVIIHDMHGTDTGLTHEEEEFFAHRVWQLMTSCTERRTNDYERLSWWDYLEADRFSKIYQSLLVAGLTRTLVAAQARSASTKTGGDIFLQLIFNMMSPGVNTDRVLNGPTNDQWLDPWLTFLLEKGVRYHKHNKVVGIAMKDGRISTVRVKDENGTERDVTGDLFVLATPVERAAELITMEMEKVDPNLTLAKQLATSVSWMNGIQYYLNEDVVINQGHVIYDDSEWAVTSISQMQFWKGYDLGDRYNGKVKGVLSVDISDWLYTKFKGRLAEDCDPKDVSELVWEQLEKSLNVGGKVVLRKNMIEHWYLDRDIRWRPIVHGDLDKEPLLVNTVNSWALRPEAMSRIPNLFLASDYVRTYTDLATMEGANEAARRAVNGIIATTGSSAPLCGVWPMKEPVFFAPLKWLDARRYAKGLPWSEHLPWWMKVFMVPWSIAYAIWFFLFTIFSLVFR